MMLPQPDRGGAPPLVTVILKTLNEQLRIAAAIDSVLAALQSIESEVIVADSGSRDDTVRIASSMGVRVVVAASGVAPSCGLGPQLGFQYSHGVFICLMDGDMLLDPDFLPAALAYLDANPGAAGVTGHVEEMNLDNLEFIRRVRRSSPERRVGDVDRMNGGGLYRREAILDVGYFSDRNLHGYEEFDLGIRLRSRCWTIHRLDRRFVRHFGHSIDAYALLVRRWRSGYLFGIGEMIRANAATPRWRFVRRELPELRLWMAVYVWLGLVLAALSVVPAMPSTLALVLCLLLLPPVAMSIRHRSMALGTYAVTAWLFHAASLPIGLLRRRHSPSAWIDSRVMPPVAANRPSSDWPR